MKFISHLDLMRLFQRATRRARLPVKITEGFSPHPKMSFRRALKLGVESNNEEVILRFTEPIEPSEILNRLNKQLPEGIRIIRVSGYQGIGE